MSRPTLTLPHMPETATVREAKELVSGLGEVDHDADLIAWTMRLIHARDEWFNTKRRSR